MRRRRSSGVWRRRWSGYALRRRRRRSGCGYRQDTDGCECDCYVPLVATVSAVVAAAAVIIFAVVVMILLAITLDSNYYNITENIIVTISLGRVLS